MNLRQLYVGKAVGFVVALIVLGLVSGFYALNTFIYSEKQAKGEQAASKNEATTSQEIIGENMEGEADPSFMTLGMKSWTWVADVYADGKRVNRSDSKPFVLTFGSNGTFTATGDCNSVGGTYSADEKKNITFSKIVTTKMYCEGSKENTFTFMLGDTSSYHFTSRGELVMQLRFDNGLAVFR